MTKVQKSENSKKQTWWVVFMVGLMVVLSAYYWLSDDAPKPVATTLPIQSEEITIDPNEPPAVPPAHIEPQKTDPETKT
ncbi:MAG: hypothetical protein KGO83_01440, partial [Paenibacillaceae bacterium]|nr:hypothetical protein [Paenibacillaceae bacterium]